jgi:thiamine biosynthesis lipoprotein
VPDPAASYRDVIVQDGSIRFLRPLWLDLGGIAKGYAADRAAAVLREHGATQARIDAGGDLVTLGDGPHRIALDDGRDARDAVAVLEIGEGAVATSSNRGEVRRRNRQHAIGHLDGRDRDACSSPRTVSVVAPSGLYADALTKIVMVLGDASVPLLARYDATAYIHDDTGGWRCLGHA